MYELLRWQDGVLSINVWMFLGLVIVCFFVWGLSK